MRKRQPKLYGVILFKGASSEEENAKAYLQQTNANKLEQYTDLFNSLAVKDILLCRHQGLFTEGSHITDGPMEGIYSALRDTKSAKVANTLLIMSIDMPASNLTIMRDLLNFGYAMQCAVHYSGFELPLYLPNNAENREFAKRVVTSKEDSSVKRYLNIINSTQVNSAEVATLLASN
ncbi:hypothetical protein ACOYR1_02605 [Thalassotalea piscium]